MKRTLILGTILTALILLPGLASATHITEVTGNADCEDWNASATVHWRSTVFAGDLDYSVVLFDAGGAEVTRFEWAGAITRDENVDTTYLYGDMWNMDLCGDYTVVGTIHVSAPYPNNPNEESTMEFTTSFTCICDEPGGCFLTPGYWKNHTENWAQDTLMLGGVELSQDELLAILNAPVRGDATVILAYHLIAAKLNVLNGADDSIQSVIDDADAYLAMHPVFSKPGRNDGRQDALDMKTTLCNYNEQGCEDDDEEEEEGGEKAAVENLSWDSLKAQYR
jgi:hypothetical protein